MKSALLPGLILLTSYVFAQLPERPEDISPLLIGEKIPDINIETVEGMSVSTPTVLGSGKSILIFYRGGWCPYCNTHLNEVGRIEADLQELGYTIVAISPDAPENLRKSIDKNKLTYTLLSDKHGALARATGLAFKAPSNYEKLLKENQGSGNELHLPVPALFIVDEKSEILFEYINPNYKTRISGDLLLAVARSLAGKK
jgi:peroxiredoxin